jgi:hypothetical protein
MLKKGIPHKDIDIEIDVKNKRCVVKDVIMYITRGEKDNSKVILNRLKKKFNFYKQKSSRTKRQVLWGDVKILMQVIWEIPNSFPFERKLRCAKHLCNIFSLPESIIEESKHEEEKSEIVNESSSYSQSKRKEEKSEIYTEKDSHSQLKRKQTQGDILENNNKRYLQNASVDFELEKDKKRFEHEMELNKIELKKKLSELDIMDLQFYSALMENPHVQSDAHFATLATTVKDNMMLRRQEHYHSKKKEFEYCIDISEIVVLIGHKRLDNEKLKQLGSEIAGKYKRDFPYEPSLYTDKYVNGGYRKVRAYPSKYFEWLQSCVKDILQK